MSDMRDEMLRTLDRIVADTLTVQERGAADAHGQAGHGQAGHGQAGHGQSTKLWAVLEEQGITMLGEAGSEIGYADAMAVVQRASFHAAPVPLAEHILARRLLSAANIGIPEGVITVATPALAGQSASSALAAVPYARSSSHVVVASGNELTLYRHGGKVAAKGHNQAGEPRDSVNVADLKAEGSAKLAYAERRVLLEGALIRSVQLSGALERGLSHSLIWANERVQFGRPISKFQAIQHALAVMASEVAAARAAVDMAVERAATEADWFTTAVAKARAGEAAGKVANAAHAAFGAMGFTREHLLHYTTRRLWAWRDEFGQEQHWQAELGRHIASLGGEKLWAEITARG